MENQEKIETVEIVSKDHEPGEKLFTEDDMRRAYSYGMFAVTTGRNFKDWFINYKSK
jgi:hypothetical protein